MPDIDNGMDITKDLLRCNRCGKCISVCPVYEVYHEEWASARGKVELAEAFFRGDPLDEKEFQRVFDLCLQCMACEENCPSGMRANEVIMAVRAEMAKRGLIPRIRKIALKMLESMDSIVFKAMRRFGLSRKGPLHGYGSKGTLSFLYPLFGWSADRSVPLPGSKPFLYGNHGVFPASRLEGVLPEPEMILRAENTSGKWFSDVKAADLVRRILAAREKNIADGASAYFFVGHAVNHFFPEEAETTVWILNLFGVDVLVPGDQQCCGAPYFYSGDIDNARRVAEGVIEGFAKYDYDWIVTTCASGGRMLREEFPRLFGLTSDEFFEIGWESGSEVFIRKPGDAGSGKEYKETAELYRKHIENRVRDLNELLAGMLGFEKKPSGFDTLFGDKAGESDCNAVPARDTAEDGGRLPVVTYHHPCHLNRGQGVNWQPEAILESLCGYRYVKMPEAEKCCGGGGAFTFAHSGVSEKIASKKADSIEAVSPDIVTTSCPVCRIQLMDMIRRRFVVEVEKSGGEARGIPVSSPVELLAEDLRLLIRSAGPVHGKES